MTRRKVGLGPGTWRGLALTLPLPALLLWAGTAGSSAAPPPRARKGASAAPPDARRALDAQFGATVRPLLRSYCDGCHGKEMPQAQLDLSRFADTASVARDLPHWMLVAEKVAAKQMPPPGSPQPTDAQRAALGAWVRAVRTFEAERTAGDPGPVTARRLSNAEYDYTIRDLTGVDLRPTREFPVDPANQEGFDNSGESLTVSPALLKKYVEAAKSVADNLVLTTDGIAFAPHPVLAETDRDKFCVLRIVDFYRKQPTDFADYFRAAWRFKHRAALGAPNATLASVAADTKVSPRYLATVWDALTAPGAPAVGPMATLRAKWAALPAPADAAPGQVKAECEKMRDWTVALRGKVAWRFPNLKVPGGFSTGGQCFVLWKNRQYASHRRQFDPATLQVGGVPKTVVTPARKRGGKEEPEKSVTDPVDPDLFVPADEAARAPYLESFARFADVFPDYFYVAERGLMFGAYGQDGDPFKVKGRLLTAGLHNAMGYFRDDAPLRELILDDAGRRTLDTMWRDFDTVASVPERMHLEFFFYERAESGTITDPEFDFARPEDKAALSDEKIKLLGDLYLAKAKRKGAPQETLDAIAEHFRWVSKNIRETERARAAAEPVQRAALLDFARRAYRRPLTAAERDGLTAFYWNLRKKDGLTHEEAARDTVTRVLLSPNFLFRVDLEDAAPPTARMRTAANRPGAAAANQTVPLSDYALASRLSYFLWSSMPDAELLSHAAKGDLHKPEVLAAQARRMLKDPRVRALALEFGGNWLDFRRFEEHNAVDRERFPAFTNDLREAMFEEPVRFLTDTFRNDRSVREMVYGKYTFVNPVLAKHYGMPEPKAPADSSGDGWVRVDDADRYGRGGLLPMGVFLTKNSPGLRTSPVKRGYWVVRRVLGEYIPPPPAAVPELPKDESQLGERTLRQALAKHRENPACASCHARFDAYGLVFEGYGPVGERREKDLGGRPVDARAPFPGGPDRAGVEGLRAFVREKREGDFLDTLDRKLLSYALGRSLQPSDDATLALMRRRLPANGYRFGTLVETVVTSPQFRYRRAPSGGAPAPAAAKLARR